ncbi:hypothetical protein TRFO_12565 [Tritrichomonas foetus]|uniref:Uncharacterized protein n=1 Tax=Tritrichomonas foetus TaxID=1144522 RepID=A0A1J4L5K6_9EUKA|nr:hypothetical protein TRFO_12565 [Tritrichomonas foetus]|eukprot:OHT17230.1 hypothetical protein TRFO_12565 [Tritrichomonas foetus]
MINKNLSSEILFTVNSHISIIVLSYNNFSGLTSINVSPLLLKLHHYCSLNKNHVYPVHPKRYNENLFPKLCLCSQQDTEIENDADIYFLYLRNNFYLIYGSSLLENTIFTLFLFQIKRFYFSSKNFKIRSYFSQMNKDDKENHKTNF